MERVLDQTVQVAPQAGRHLDYSFGLVQAWLVEQLAEGPQAPEDFQLEELDRVRVDFGLEDRGRAQLGECLTVGMVRLFPRRFRRQTEQRLEHMRVDAPVCIHFEREYRCTPPPQRQSGGLTPANGLQVSQPLVLCHVGASALLIAVPRPLHFGTL
ncbi:hypothetical protein [Streptomyces sp. NRRL S-37]|uniref:hypothetical protein n=1 Tax=Streptomyces sp. NRRL S-37 TaxID=1463903 RepID=UPI00131DF755|nr:hypothetical protein [Streptomyces sp. NRRL S-37]